MNDKEKLLHAEQWVNAHINTLRQTYSGEWIAVMDNEVVGHNKDPQALSHYLAEWDNSFAYWEYIHPQAEIDLWVKIWRGFED